MQALVQQVHWLHKPKTKHLFLPLVFFSFLSFIPASRFKQTRLVLQPIIFKFSLGNKFFRLSKLSLSRQHQIGHFISCKVTSNSVWGSDAITNSFLVRQKKDKENATAAGNKSSYGFSHHFHWVFDDLPACKYVIWECGIWNTSQPWGVCIPGLWIKNICNCNGHPSEHAHSDWIRAAYLSCVNCDLMTGRGCLFTANQTWQFKSANIQWCQGVRGLNGGGGGV